MFHPEVGNGGGGGAMVVVVSRTQAPCIGSAESLPLATREVPMAAFKRTKGKAHPSYCEAGGQRGWKAGDVLAEVAALGVERWSD